MRRVTAAARHPLHIVCSAQFRLKSADPRRPIAGHKMKRSLDPQDLALRTLIVLAGAVSAVLLAMKGQAMAIPALALGATLGAFAMRHSEE